MNKFEKRIDKLQEKLQKRGLVPPQYAGPYISWSDNQKSVEDIERVKAELMKVFGTVEGVKIYEICWDEPEGEAGTV